MEMPKIQIRMAQHESFCPQNGFQPHKINFKSSESTHAQKYKNPKQILEQLAQGTQKFSQRRPKFKEYLKNLEPTLSYKRMRSHHSNQAGSSVILAIDNVK